MSLLQTVARDYRVVDGTEPVTFVSKGSPPLTLDLTHAKGMDLTIQEIGVSGGFFAMGDKRWMLPADQIPAANAPKQGDEVIAGGVRFIIAMGCVLDPLKIRWDCVTRKAR